MIKAYLAEGMDKEEFVQRALCDYTGRNEAFEIRRKRTGKPYAVNGPCYSFSDSCGFLLCVVSEREIGGDIERRRSAAKYMRIAKRFFAPDEAAAATEENFFEIYTAKEAYVKYTEMGIFSDMERFSVQSGRVGNVNIIRFSDGDCICAAASSYEKEVEIKWIY